MPGTLREIRPTRRGVAVAAVALLAFAVGALAGARSLNAVVVPALVGLLAGALQLSRAAAPTITRSRPEAGFPGETRRVTVTVDSEVPCTVTDGLERGVALAGARAGDPVGTVGHGGRFEYEIEFGRRGAHELGPARCRLTDSLGLFRTDHEAAETTTALVYPPVSELTGDPSGLVDRVLGDERTSFDRLREFTLGDTMRDIEWRASAKRPADEFVVAEYESRSAADHVAIVGESALGSADAMASTVASVAAYLHDAGVTVTVTVPGGECVARPGETASVLRLLARTEDGWVDAERRNDADVYVLGEGGRATVTLGDRDVDAERLVGADRSREVLA